jgi:hypothetical protein
VTEYGDRMAVSQNKVVGWHRHQRERKKGFVDTDGGGRWFELLVDGGQRGCCS